MTEEIETPARVAATEAIAVKTLTETRHKTHGSWVAQSSVTNMIKRDMRGSKNWHSLPPYRAEALDQIAHKIGRILEGDFATADHWNDISGYAFLGLTGGGSSDDPR